MNGVLKLLIDGHHVVQNGSIVKQEGNDLLMDSKRGRTEKLRKMFSRNNRIKAEFLLFFAVSHIDMLI